MGVVFASIAPHGSEAIPQLGGDMYEAFSETNKSMEELTRLLRKQEPETLVLATPHGLRLDATIGVITSEFTEGSLESNSGKMALRCECDRSLAIGILRSAKESWLPVVDANHGSSEGPASSMPMDWGALIPLWFLVGQDQKKPKVVLVTPSREIPFESLVRFGRVVAESAESSAKKVAFIASADQGHAHRADGPYGFNPASSEFDEVVKRAVLENDLAPLLSLSPKFIEDAKPYSVWQLVMLHGILKHTPMESRLLSYQRPTYFGLLCALACC